MSTGACPIFVFTYPVDLCMFCGHIFCYLYIYIYTGTASLLKTECVLHLMSALFGSICGHLECARMKDARGAMYGVYTGSVGYVNKFLQCLEFSVRNTAPVICVRFLIVQYPY